MIAGVTLMGIATVVVVGAATKVVFAVFHSIIAVVSSIGSFVHDAPESAILVVFASAACLPLRGELPVHLVDSVAQAIRNADLVRQLDDRRAEVEKANLRAVSRRISAELRDSDLLSRLGGGLCAT